MFDVAQQIIRKRFGERRVMKVPSQDISHTQFYIGVFTFLGRLLSLRL